MVVGSEKNLSVVPDWRDLGPEYNVFEVFRNGFRAVLDPKLPNVQRYKVHYWRHELILGHGRPL